MQRKCRGSAEEGSADLLQRKVFLQRSAEDRRRDFLQRRDFCSGEQRNFAAAAAAAAEVQRVPEVRVKLHLSLVLLFKHKPPLKIGRRHTHVVYSWPYKFCGML